MNISDQRLFTYALTSTHNGKIICWNVNNNLIVIYYMVYTRTVLIADGDWQLMVKKKHKMQ